MPSSMPTVRALAFVSDVSFREDAEGNKVSQTVKLDGRYESDPNSPNSVFWKATPVLHHEMTITNPASFGMFKPGAKVWIDFTVE